MHFEGTLICPKCGFVNVRTTALTRLANEETEIDVDSLGRAYSEISSAAELTASASNALGGTIDWMKTIPRERQDDMGISDKKKSLIRLKKNGLKKLKARENCSYPLKSGIGSLPMSQKSLKA